MTSAPVVAPPALRGPVERAHEVAVDAALLPVQDALDLSVGALPPGAIVAVLGAARERVGARLVAAAPAGDAVEGAVGQEAVDALLLAAVQAEAAVEGLHVMLGVSVNTRVDGSAGPARVGRAAGVGQARVRVPRRKAERGAPGEQCGEQEEGRGT